jgi:ribosomal protein L29
MLPELTGAACSDSTGAPIGSAGAWETTVAIASVTSNVPGTVEAAGIARMWETGKREGASRTFEKNRIAALERGLDLKGEATRLRREIFDLRCQSTTEKIADNSRIGKARKDLARVLTEQTSRAKGAKA